MGVIYTGFNHVHENQEVGVLWSPDMDGDFDIIYFLQMLDRSIVTLQSSTQKLEDKNIQSEEVLEDLTEANCLIKDANNTRQVRQNQAKYGITSSMKIYLSNKCSEIIKKTYSCIFLGNFGHIILYMA